MQNDRLLLLSTLKVLLEERSVRQCAQIMGTSPSTISRRLGELRAWIRDPVFVRVNNTMQPTRRALAIGQELPHRLRALEELIRAADPAMDAEREIVIAMSDACYLTFLPQALNAVVRQAPGLRVELRSVDAGAAPLAEELIGGGVDLYLGPPLARSDNLYQRTLLDAGFLTVARRDHPLLGDPVGLEAFCACPHVLVSARHPARSPVDERLERLGLSRRVAVTTRSFLGAGALVAAGILICTMPEQPAQTVARLHGLRTFPPPLDLPQIPICAQWHERIHRDPAHRWVRQQVFAACGGDPPE